MQLEDFGFCKRGESGPFVESGALSRKNGSLPTNTHGGSLCEAYVHGLSIGASVELVSEDMSADLAIPRFRLVQGAAAHGPLASDRRRERGLP